MKIINDFLEKHGADPLIHFGYGGWITQLGSLFNIYGLIVMFIVMICLTLLKEYYFDTEVSKTDIKYSIYGGITSIIISLIILMIF